jgi:outer membrane protein OmpA-like peptidoglycan-associated protein
MRHVRHWLVVVVLFSLSCASPPDRQPPPEPIPAPAPVAPAVPEPPPPPDPRDFTAAVHFGAGSADLSADGIRELESFAAKLRPFPDRYAHVVGYSEATDAEKEDRWLSERRAKAVASFLVSRGIATDHVTLQGLGTEAPTGDDPQGDRRLVEVTVH